ncbi:MAG: hypothetical protein AAF802_17825 [Planctomycetota bacterium]
MNPQHSSNRPQAAEYEVEMEPANNDGDASNASRSPQRLVAGAEGEVSSILLDVLGETLVRRQESAGDLLRALTDFRQQTQTDRFDESVVPKLIRVVLRHRLGESFNKLPNELFAEVGQSLWDHKGSRHRVERLWNALGAER